MKNSECAQSKWDNKKCKEKAEWFFLQGVYQKHQRKTVKMERMKQERDVKSEW